MLDDSYFDDDPIVKKNTYKRPIRVKHVKLEGKKYCHASEVSYNNTGRWRYIVLKNSYRNVPRQGKNIVHGFLLGGTKHVVILGEDVNRNFIAALHQHSTRNFFNQFKRNLVLKHIQKHISIINRYDNIQFIGTLNQVLNKLLDLRGISKSTFLREVVNELISQ